MFSDELINFLKNNFPEQLGEISAAIDLLVESIDDAAEAIAAKGNKLSSDKEFKNAAVLMSRADELQAVSKEIEAHADVFKLDEVALVSEDDTIEDIEKTYPNYSDYEVDVSMVHTLHENYVHKRPHAFELKGQKVYVTKWKEMLVETCNILAEINPGLISDFPCNPRFNGRKSQYFSIKDSGLMRSPLKLGNLDMFVETNFCANDIRNLIIKMIKHYGIPTAEYKIYLRADYTELHRKAKNNEDKDDDVKPVPKNINKQIQHKTPANKITDDCIQHIGGYLQQTFIKHSRTTYQTSDFETTVICLASTGKNTGRRIEYWFGLRLKQKKVLEACEKSYLALGCGLGNKIIFVPYTVFHNWLKYMSISYKMQEKTHWNIVIIEKKGNYMLRLKGSNPNVDLTEYVLAV